MSWVRLDDRFPQHPKFEGWTASQKWGLVELFAYCAVHRTQGHVPGDLSLLPRAVTPKIIRLAQESGFLDENGDGSLVVHDWEVYNPADPTAADRMKRLRERNANRNANRNASRNNKRT
jgi:hypothetical protein